MSKRNKKKLKKILRAQLSANKSQVRESVQTPMATAGGQSFVKEEAGQRELGQDYASREISDEVREVKGEIRKIILTVVSLVVIILILYFINNKTDIILKAGEWLATRFNVNV